ncbi:MAG: hypothetical protein ACOC2R_10080 [Spirochaetota bacterium]
MPKLPEWKIERYLLGELPDEELQRIDRLRAEDAEFDAEMAAKLDRLQASNQEILAKYPAEEVVAKIRQRADRSSELGAGVWSSAASETGAGSHAEPAGDTDSTERRHRPFFALPQVVFPAALAAALTLFILFSGQFAFLGLPGGPGGGRGAAGNGAGGSGTATSERGTGAQSGSPEMQGLEGDTGIRLKGMQPGIQVYRKAGEEVEMLEPGDRAAAGDLLQLGFVAPEADYAVLFSVDGRGVVTLHTPISAGQTSELDERGRVLIEASYRLDDAPDFERFYLLTSTSELDAAAVLEKVRSYIRRQGQFPSSGSQLNSDEGLADFSEGQIQWYVFTVKK